MAKANRTKKTIFFIESVTPTDEEKAEFETLPPGAVMRRADLIKNDGAIEDFDFVAGAVPHRYEKEAEAKAKLEAENPPIETPKVDGSTVAKTSPVAPPKPVEGAKWTPNT